MARRVSKTASTTDEHGPEGQYCLHSRRRKPSVLVPLSASQICGSLASPASARSSAQCSTSPKAATSPSPSVCMANRRSSNVSVCSTDSMPPSASATPRNSISKEVTPRSSSKGIRTQSKASVFSRGLEESAFGCFTPLEDEPRLLADEEASTCPTLPSYDRHGSSDDTDEVASTCPALPSYDRRGSSGEAVDRLHTPPLLVTHRRSSKSKSRRSSTIESTSTGPPESSGRLSDTSPFDDIEGRDLERPEAAAAAKDFRNGQKMLDQNVDFMLARIGALAPPQDRPKTPTEQEPPVVGKLSGTARTMNPRMASTMSRVRAKMAVLSLTMGDME